MEKIIMILKELIKALEFVDGYLSKVHGVFSPQHKVQIDPTAPQNAQMPQVPVVNNPLNFFGKAKTAIQHIIKVITTIPEVLAEGQNTIAQSRLKEAYDELKNSANSL